MSKGSKISNVGFEIEGGWDGEPGLSPFDDLILITDLSINGQQLRERRIAATHIGEAVSPVMDYSKPTVWKEWLAKHWPNCSRLPDRANNTCGFHIHLSLKSHRDYYLLTKKSFLFFLQDGLVEFAEDRGYPPDSDLFLRLSGRNPFCLLGFDAARQMDIGAGGGIHNARYGFLNFAWTRHGTVEFRALPTFTTWEETEPFVDRYFLLVEQFLDMKKSTRISRSWKPEN